MIFLIQVTETITDNAAVLHIAHLAGIALYILTVGLQLHMAREDHVTLISTIRNLAEAMCLLVIILPILAQRFWKSKTTLQTGTIITYQSLCLPLNTCRKVSIYLRNL